MVRPKLSRVEFNVVSSAYTCRIKLNFLLDLKGMQRIKKNIYIMDENDSLSEYIKIPFGHNRTNGAVYSKINFKVEICSAL